MSSGLLPPIPDLIPIAALRKSPCGSNNNNNNCGGRRRDCAPCVEVMGEQRSRRTGNQPAVDLIDSSGSRGTSAAPQAPQSRKARSERHRKSDRRREHRKPATRTRSDSSKHNTRFNLTPSTSPERPANPRVNPIFVWVRQEDTRIVDVKCEDYDKRNRILLTKTAQGWRAIPRTETLVPILKEAVAADKDHNHHHHHHHHRSGRKSKRSKIRRKSTAVQVDSGSRDQEDDEAGNASPSWMSSDVESLLPSHTIINKRSPSLCTEAPSAPDIINVNSVVTESAQTQPIKCSADKICDVTPLDNLLAVAELEFNQQIQSGEWNKTASDTNSDILNNDNDNNVDISDDVQKEFFKDMEQLNSLIESCSNSNNNIEDNKLDLPNEFDSSEPKSEDCDYNEDDDNNIAMDDILSRLEQSLRSPECTDTLGNVLNINNCNTNSYDSKVQENNDMMDDVEAEKSLECFTSDINENSYKSVPDDEFVESFFDQTDEPTTQEEEETIMEEEKPKTPSPILMATEDEVDKNEQLVESSTADEEPTDLSLTITCDEAEVETSEDAVEGPTDLSVPKFSIQKSPIRVCNSLSRSPSQNSEAIQSPQPSGIPAVPPSPDLVSTSASATNTKSKSIFLEGLLNPNNQKMLAINSEVTIIRQKEPLDLGKCRKSASPTVTCSQEVSDSARIQFSEPPAKKFKPQDVILKNILDEDLKQKEAEAKSSEKALPETPRLLELLKTDSEPDSLTQLRQLLTDPILNVPDPMLVPKEKLSSIISHPGKEIPKLLKQRPELRLPEALAFPHLLQDPDILVITLQQLETIILKQGQSQLLKEINKSSEKAQHEKSHKRLSEAAKQSPKKKANDNVSRAINQETTSKCTPGINELASDIDAATTAAFNQMMWLPYLNHLETMSFGNNAEVLKMLSNTMPMYPNQIPDLSHLFGNNTRFPPQIGFPMRPPINYNNPLELSMWQEAMLQANMLRPKNPFDNFNPKHTFRDYLEKITPAPTKKPNQLQQQQQQQQQMLSKHSLPNHFYTSQFNANSSNNPTSTSGHSSSYQNSFLNVPSSFSNNSAKHIQIPQFNPMFSQKPAAKSLYAPKHHHKQDSGKSIFPPANFFPQMQLEEKNATVSLHQQHQQQQPYRPKVACKSFASFSNKSAASHADFQKEKSSHPTSQPIDLSGSTTPGSKLKVKQHLIDPVNMPKLLKHDDVPEVGSTTASIEEMQDAHKHLWHPLFGNQKGGYSSPWNWTTVTATGE